MKGLFSVFEKDTKEWDKDLMTYIAKKVEVYAVRDDKNADTHFLIYEDGEWKYRSAKYYKNK